MYNNYEKERKELSKKYEQDLKALEMLEKIELEFDKRRKNREKAFILRTELRVWNEVCDYARTLSFIADHYGYKLYQFEKSDTDIKFFFQERYNI
ncbi:MAG: hypothetical protein MJ244_00755 [Clostridia bacterium]|nr:hypothetical protein [Clostridia bacterium]